MKNMDNIIHLLPEVVSNQIAAGEVVQRPSSLVKELTENSIDAGATEITLNVTNFGKTLLQVIDNGKGMSEVDARMCFEKYATSKIKKAEDLYNLTTMGFRGEALASIGAVAHVELKTCIDDNELGTKVLIEGSKVISQTPESVPKGTSIAVKNLFFNVPARRNFLKSDQVEFKHILDEFQRIALSNPDVHFIMFHNGREIYNLPNSKLSQRIVNIFKKSYKNQLIFCREETADLKIKGYIGKPEYSKKTRGEQFFFVNNRYIKSPLLHSAIMNSYQDIIKPGYIPFYILFFEINSNKIDVNIHPTKSEIKFDDERMVYSILQSAIKRSISSFQLNPPIDFKENVNSTTHQLLEAASITQVPKRISIKERQYSQFKNHDNQDTRKEDWKKFLDDINTTPIKEDLQSNIVTIESKVNNKSNSEDYEFGKSIKIQLNEKYLLTYLKSGIVIINKQAAHERVLYEKYLSYMRSDGIGSQQLLFPQSLDLNPTHFFTLSQYKKELKNIGFNIQFTDSNTLMVKGAPLELDGKDFKYIFEELVDRIDSNKEIGLGKDEVFAKLFAKRASISENKMLSNSEVESLIEQLFSSSNPNYTPDGRKILYKISIDEIEKEFQ